MCGRCSAVRLRALASWQGRSDCCARRLSQRLACQLFPVLDSVRGPEQTAFVPSRRIDDNILLLQSIPHYLRLRQQHAVVAFLAYDTVDRDFLASVMEAVGVGPAFLVAFLLTGS